MDDGPAPERARGGHAPASIPTPIALCTSACHVTAASRPVHRLHRLPVLLRRAFAHAQASERRVNCGGAQARRLINRLDFEAAVQHLRRSFKTARDSQSAPVCACRRTLQWKRCTNTDDSLSFVGCPEPPERSAIKRNTRLAPKHIPPVNIRADQRFLRKSCMHRCFPRHPHKSPMPLLPCSRTSSL